jgi:hypothetical protein
MKLADKASKLLTNKYFLYFIVFLASTNVLGYLVTNNLNAVAFFALVGVLTYHFSKNLAVVLLVALISTNFMMTNKMMREGLENQNAPSLDKVADTDPEIGTALPIVQKSKDNDEVAQKMKMKALSSKGSDSMSDNENIDINNSDLNKVVEEKNAPEGFGEKVSNLKKGKAAEHFGPRLDYAATIEQSYQNLDELLGSDSIKQLTNDTQKLMQQQQNLFNTMNQMVPVLEGAQNMLSKFDVGSLTNSLKGISSLGGAPTVV